MNENVESLMTEFEMARTQEELMVLSMQIPYVAQIGSVDYDRLLRASGHRRIELMKEKILV